MTAVDIDSMFHTVNLDGSMDFSWTSPVPEQKYQARIYRNGERVYQSGYTFDLVNDRFDMTTETRLQMNGWAKDRSAAIEPIVEGEYILTAEFEDGHVETHSYTLSADDLTPVDADTMGYEIFENGAIWFYWSLQEGVSGQRYLVRIRSKDGSREFISSSPDIDRSGQYFSVWDLRALPQGDQFNWFVRAYGGDDGDTQVETWSNQLLTYNPFDITAYVRTYGWL